MGGTRRRQAELTEPEKQAEARLVRAEKKRKRKRTSLLPFRLPRISPGANAPHNIFYPYKALSIGPQPPVPTVLPIIIRRGLRLRTGGAVPRVTSTNTPGKKHRR